MKGKNTREKEILEIKKNTQILVIKTTTKFLSLDDKDQKNALNVRQIKV